LQSETCVSNMKQDKSRRSYSSRSILNALAILESLGSGKRARSLSELSRECRIPKATALRYLAAFEKSGYAARDARSGRYLLGIRVMDLSRRFYEQYEMLPLARDHLEDLAQATGETAHLAVLHAPDVVYIDMADSPQRVRAFIDRGERLPAYCVASGRAILAHSEPEVVETVMAAGMKRHTKNTITTRAGLLRELQRTAKRGYATTPGEWREDVIGISAPLHAFGSVIGAIGISCPLSRVNQRKIDAMGEIVSSTALRLSVMASNGKQFGKTSEGRS
jgi:IclR family transcriptional regulator, KDG regulon repressor